MNQLVHVTDQWQISNLQWPRYTLGGPMPWAFEIAIYDLVAGAYQVQRKLRYDPFYSPTANTFVKTALNVDKKRMMETDVTYTFTFICTNDIPSGASLVLTLPSYYNLIASYPPVVISYPDFENASPTSILTSYYTANQITIFNIGQVYQGNQFKIIISGMRNPNYNGAMNTFSVATMLNGYNVNYANNFITVTLQAAFTPGLINVNSIAVFPINQGVTATYTFAFTPQTKLNTGAEIHIAFPPQYLSLPQNPICYVTGGLTTFTVCYTLVNEIIMVLDSTYNTDVIYLEVLGITNPSVSSTTAFRIYTYYDGNTMDQTTASALSSLMVNLSPKTSSPL